MMKQFISTCVLTVMICLAVSAQTESNQDFDDVYSPEQGSEVIVDQPQPRPQQQTTDKDSRQSPDSEKSPEDLLDDIVIDLVDFADRFTEVLFDLDLHVENDDVEVDVRAKDLYIADDDIRDLERDLEDAADDIEDGLEDAVAALHEARRDLDEARRDVYRAQRDLHRDRELLEVIAVFHVFEHIGFGVVHGILDTADWILDF